MLLVQAFEGRQTPPRAGLNLLPIFVRNRCRFGAEAQAFLLRNSLKDQCVFQGASILQTRIACCQRPLDERKTANVIEMFPIRRIERFVGSTPRGMMYWLLVVWVPAFAGTMRERICQTSDGGDFLGEVVSDWISCGRAPGIHLR